MIGVYCSYTEKDGSFAARLILGHALRRDYGIARAEVQKEPSGKPYLAGYPHIHISISHTDGVVAVAVADCPVGIDVQAVGKLRPRIAQRLLTDSEREYVAEDPLRFYEIWTRKESYAKLLGTGLTTDFGSVDTLGGVAEFVQFRLCDAVACVCSFGENEVLVEELEETDYDRI